MLSNRNGFTLVEFLVSIVILMIGLLGLLQTINVAIDQDLGNVFRNEAVIVVDEMMMKKRAKTFDSVSTVVNKTYSENRTVRGIPKTFTMTETVKSVTANSKQISITASWTKKNSTYNHSATSVVSTN